MPSHIYFQLQDRDGQATIIALRPIFKEEEVILPVHLRHFLRLLSVDQVKTRNISFISYLDKDSLFHSQNFDQRRTLLTFQDYLEFSGYHFVYRRGPSIWWEASITCRLWFQMQVPQVLRRRAITKTTKWTERNFLKEAMRLEKPFKDLNSPAT